jgi:predicted phosphodiesterase
MILNTSVSVGAEAPFKIIHISDTHFTLADSRDNSEKNRIATKRRHIFPHSEAVRDTAVRLSRELGCPIIHTGDHYDFLSHPNLEEVHRFVTENDVLYAAGNHDFSHYLGEETENEEYKLRSYRDVQSLHKNNIRMDSRVICGVNFVVLDDSYFQFHPDHVKFLLSEAEKGLPIVLLYHKPVACRELLAFAGEKGRVGCLVCPPDSCFDGKDEEWIAERRADEVTLEVTELISSLPQVKCIINGHMHENFTSLIATGVPLILTANDTVRVIEFT